MSKRSEDFKIGLVRRALLHAGLACQKTSIRGEKNPGKIFHKRSFVKWAGGTEEATYGLIVAFSGKGGGPCLTEDGEKEGKVTYFRRGAWACAKLIRGSWKVLNGPVPEVANHEKK